MSDEASVRAEVAEWVGTTTVQRWRLARATALELAGIPYAIGGSRPTYRLVESDPKSRVR